MKAIFSLIIGIVSLLSDVSVSTVIQRSYANMVVLCYLSNTPIKNLGENRSVIVWYLSLGLGGKS